MAKFKAGDKVRNVSDTPKEWGGNDGPVVGEVYTVAKSWNGALGYDYLRLVEFEAAYSHHSRNVEKYELVEPETSFDLLSAMMGKPLKFRSGCTVKFVSYVPDAKPHCQLVLLNPSTGNVVTRYANGKSSTETYDEPGDILIAQC
jgi:hypothetical protein